MDCSRCSRPAVTWLRYAGDHLCADHFRQSVERRVKRELRAQVDVRRGARIAVGMSGGKDSSAAAVLLSETLGRRRDVTFVGITVDEGIAAYRPAGIASARRLCERLGFEHRVVAHEGLVGRTMDDVVRTDPGTIPCAYCGPFRRQALNLAAREAHADYLATGLNLDDTAQSILMNVARGDVGKLARLGPHDRVQEGLVPRIQPLRLIPEKEVYLYALLRGIEFHDGTCPYAARAQRGRFRDIVNRLEADSPGTRHAIVAGYDAIREVLQERFPPAPLRPCARCGAPTVHEACKACELRDRLARMSTPEAAPIPT